MREGTIYKHLAQGAARDGILLDQFEFLKTREEAATNLIKASGLRDRIRWMFWPELFLATLDAVQIQLLATAKAERAEALKAAKKPDLTAGVSAAVGAGVKLRG